MNAVMESPTETPKEAARRLSATVIADGYQPEALHEYQLADKAPLYWRIRCKHPDTGDKWIRPMHWDGHAYKLGMPAFPSGTPLYGLQRLAAEQDAVVFIVEGEKAADHLNKLGVLAVTSGSSSSAGKADWSPLQGRRCIVWPDHDEPGMGYAAGVLQHVPHARLIDPEVVNALPEKGDVVDWLEAHASATAADVAALPTVATAEAGAPDTWPEPIPLPDALPPVAPFDADLLPEGLRMWVADISERMQCPPDFSAVGAVVALSAVVGARAVMAPKERDDWRVVPNMWGVIVGRPGIMKSPALGQVMKPLERLEAGERERWQAEHAAWETDCKLAGLEAKKNEKLAAQEVTKNKAKARELLATVHVDPEPTRRRYIVNDSSVQKLADLLTVNPWGLLVYRDELHGLISSMDDEGHAGERGFYLTGYDGNQGYAVDRIGRGESYVPRVCLGMLGGMQPGKVQRYVRDAVAGGAGDDGLLQRFGLAVWPDVSGDWCRVDRWPDTDAKQTAWAVFERLSTLPTPGDEAQEWRFTPEAQGIYWEWAEPFERELRGTELHPALVSHLAKYRKLIPALALLFALVDTPDADARVGKAELLRALAWCEYLRTHAERLYAAAVIPETAGAETLLAKIQAGKLCDSHGTRLDAFTPREVAVKHWAGLSTPAEVRKAADVLADYDWLRVEVSETGPRGGRPSEGYSVHPCLRAGGTS